MKGTAYKPLLLIYMIALNPSGKLVVGHCENRLLD